MFGMQWFARSLALAAMAWGATCAVAQAAEIIVGQVAPLTGIEGRQGRSYAAGLRMAFDAANQSTTARPHTFKLLSLDDRGMPAETVSVTRKLLETQQPMVLSGYVGSRGLAELVQSGLLEKKSLALVGYRGAEIQSPHPLLFSIRAGLREELGKLTTHLATVGWTKVGLFYDDGPGASSLLATANAFADQAKVSYVARYAYDTTKGNNIGKAMDAFAASSPQAIIVVSNSSTTSAFVERYRSEGGKAHLFTPSSADVEQLSQRLGEEQMRGIVIAQVTPSPYKVTTALSKDFNDAFARSKSELERSFTMIEGFIAGRVIVEAAQRIGRTPTREGMVAALNAFGPVDIGGYSIGFSPTSHVGSNYVELSIVNALGKVKQ